MSKSKIEVTQDMNDSIESPAIEITGQMDDDIESQVVVSNSSRSIEDGGWSEVAVEEIIKALEESKAGKENTSINREIENLEAWLQDKRDLAQYHDNKNTLLITALNSVQGHLRFSSLEDKSLLDKIQDLKKNLYNNELTYALINVNSYAQTPKIDLTSINLDDINKCIAKTSALIKSLSHQGIDQHHEDDMKMLSGIVDNAMNNSKKEEVKKAPSSLKQIWAKVFSFVKYLSQALKPSPVRNDCKKLIDVINDMAKEAKIIDQMQRIINSSNVVVTCIDEIANYKEINEPVLNIFKSKVLNSMNNIRSDMNSLEGEKKFDNHLAQIKQNVDNLENICKSGLDYSNLHAQKDQIENIKTSIGKNRKQYKKAIFEIFEKHHHSIDAITQNCKARYEKSPSQSR